MNRSHWINKEIAFTERWLHTILIGSILGAFLVFILIFLQPFDTYNYSSPTKNMKLAGYGAVVLIVILLVHLLEIVMYRKWQQWRVWQEATILFLGCLIMLSAAYAYNSIIFNNSNLRLIDWWNWIKVFGSPFLLFLGPLWYFLRVRFGTIPDRSEPIPTITIVGQNKSDQLQLRSRAFLYARSQQNYADIYYQKDG
jgi:hypothetical protein